MFIGVHICAQNPVLPGYYADPSIKKYQGKYYIYATTDGYIPFGNNGQPFAWTSNNLIDWQPEILKGLPNKTIWAPAITKGKNNKFYLYTTNSVDYSGYVWEGSTPTGPFTLRNHLGGFDLEPFIDPVSGKTYVISASKMLFEMDNNVKSPSYLTKIKRTILLKGTFIDFTEAPYLFYKNGLYYLMWAGGTCWTDTYKVRYAYAKHIEGPYTDGSEPIIETDKKNGIIGPGHNSLIEIDGRYFLFYHREDDSRPPSCNYRFTCVSEIKFNKNGDINRLNYVDDLGKLLGYKPHYVNLALQKSVTTTDSDTGVYKVANVTDGRNDTRWTSKGVPATLTVDLGKIQNAEGIEVDFEFADKWQAFKVQYSNDNSKWKLLEDHSQIAALAYKSRFIKSPFKARYVKVTFNNSEDRTGSIWEFKVLGKRNN